MRKKIFICTMFVLTASIVGCGNSKDSKSQEAPEETVTVQEDTNTPVQFASSDDPYDWGYKASDYVDVGDYRSIAEKVASENPVETEAVTDAEVDSEIKVRIKKAGLMEKTTSGKARRGDLVNIDYHGTVDGEDFTGGSATGKEMTLGRNNYFSAFEDAVAGAEVGKEFTCSVTLPSSFGDVAGKTADYTVTVNSILTYPELTDSLAAELSGQKYQDADSYKESVRKELEDAAELSAESGVYTEIISNIISQADFADFTEISSQAEEDEIKSLSETSGISEDEIRKMREENGYEYDQSGFKDDLVVRAIAEKEGLEVYQKDIDNLKEKYAEEYGDEEIGYTDGELAEMVLEDLVARDLLGIS